MDLPLALPHGAWAGLQCVIVVFPGHNFVLNCSVAIFNVADILKVFK